MEKITEVAKRAFMPEFIKLSPKVSELSEILWFLFRMGGSVSVDILKLRFPEVDHDLQNLIEMGVLKSMGSGTETIVVFSESFEARLLKKGLNEITFDDIYFTLIANYSKQLGSRYKIEDLINKLSVVLATIISNATPEEPAFLNKVLRSSSEQGGRQATPETIAESKNMLEYYLFRYLGIVQPVGSFAVNLTPKGVELLKSVPELYEVYRSGAKPGVPQEPATEEKSAREKK